jgi:tetratricopeptide (TPR) repeat protein
LWASAETGNDFDIIGNRQEASVNTLQKNLRVMASAAILTAATAGLPVLALAQEAAKPAAPAAKPAVPEKKITQAEYDAYNAAAVDLGKGDFAKALADLDAWKQKFPNSDYVNDGKASYVQAYAGSKQYARAIDTAGELLSGDIDSLFPDPEGGPLVVLKVLLAVCQTAMQVPLPTEPQAATIRKAAGLLQNYTRKAEGYTDDQWKQLHGQVDPIAKQAVYFITVSPAIDALTKKDYDNAEAAFRKALQAYPDNVVVAYNLARTLMGEYFAKTHLEKFPEALYLYARAASLDPTASGVTKAWQTTETGNPTKALTSYYTQYHGSDEGLAALKDLAVKSPTPPEGFTVKSVAEVKKDKDDAFAAAHPELARWLATKTALTEGGDAYFKESLLDAQMPKLTGKVLDGKPACNSKSLIVALSDEKTPEVTLVLDTPIKGKPTAGVDITWEGAVAKAFTATPFNLTMEMEQAKVEGIEKGACTLVRPPATKKAVPPAAKKQ